MVAAGINDISESSKPMDSVLPSSVTWIQDRAEDFDPCNNIVYTSLGNKITYDYMVVAVGLENDYNAVNILALRLMKLFNKSYKTLNKYGNIFVMSGVYHRLW